jgi:hypothetical protein
LAAVGYNSTFRWLWPYAVVFNGTMSKTRVKASPRTERRASIAKVEDMQPGPTLDALVAARVMGWKDVKRQGSRSWGKKKDKAGRWRRAAIPDFSEDPAIAFAIDERMKELGLAEKYSRELSKITHARNLPLQWATPHQRCRAALKTVRK